MGLGETISNKATELSGKAKEAADKVVGEKVEDIASKAVAQVDAVKDRIFGKDDEK